jgi:hypothetical protein
MLELLKNNLPSGLTKYVVGEDQWTQCSEYTCLSKPMVQQVAVHHIDHAHARPRVKKNVSSKVDLITQLLRMIDGMSEVYPENMFRYKREQLIQHLKTFVSEQPTLEFIGQRRSREIMSYLSTDILRKKAPASFFEVCSFLLGSNVRVESKVYKWETMQTDKEIVFTLY